MLKFYLVFMPNHQYHAEKRNRFRDTADFLFNNQIPNAKNSSCDSNVQDYFYTTVHEAERFLDEFFDYHSNGHGRREALMDHWRATGNRQITNETTLRRNSRSFNSTEELFNTRTFFFYASLNALREALVYGDEQYGPLRHAERHDVEIAKRYALGFIQSLQRHEAYLHRNGII